MDGYRILTNGLLLQQLKIGANQASGAANFPVAYKSFCRLMSNMLTATVGSYLAVNHNLTSAWFSKHGSEWPAYIEIVAIGF